MNPHLVREFRARYEAVAEIEEAELQRLTVEECWQQLNALWGMALALGLQSTADREAEAEKVRERWALLRQRQT